MALISINTLAFLPNYDDLPSFVSVSDLLNHTMAFTVLYLLFERAHPNVSTMTRVSLLLFYGIMIEVVQYFLPTRSADPYDVIADSTGIVIAILLIRLLRRCRLCGVCYR